MTPVLFAKHLTTGRGRYPGAARRVISCSVTILPICILGEPVLHRPTAPVVLGPDGKPPADILALLADMDETLTASNGVGLAAPQVGAGIRMFVYDCMGRRGEVLNPVLTTSEIPEGMPEDDGSEDEGCLSVPGIQFPTGRADWAQVTGVDREGRPVTVEGTGFFARMLQHETGHLDGHLYVDVLVGRNARAAKRAIRRRKWGAPGLTWLPGVDPDPFGN